MQVRRSPRMKRTTKFLAISSAAAGVIGLAGLALAQSFDNMWPTANATWNCSSGGTGTSDTTKPFCWFFGSDWWVDWGIGQTEFDRIKSVIDNEFNPNTDLAMVENDGSNVVYNSGNDGGTGETDIIMEFRGDIPSPNQGVTWCDRQWTLLSFGMPYCAQQYIGFLDFTVVTTNLACHELGHAVGLVHGLNASPQQSNTASALGCMKTPVDVNTLGTNNITQINATY